MDILIMAAQLILSLSIMVGLHELGHMLPAKFFGMRVEKFFIGFPPKLFGKKFGDTEYGIGAIPLGGFVKISGMVDESMDKSQLAEPAKPWEFRSKPAWQRLIVMVGGVTVNAILGITIFIVLTYISGEVFLPKSEAKYGIVAYEMAQEIGLKTGDKILKVNGKDYKSFNDLRNQDVFFSSNSYYTIERDGKTMDIKIPSNLIEKMADPKKYPMFIEPIFPFDIAELMPNNPAEKAGLKKGDKIIKVDSIDIHFFHELQACLKTRQNVTINIVALRGNDTLKMSIKTTPDGKIGFMPNSLLKFDTVHYGFAQACLLGTERAFSVVIENVRGLAKIAKGEISASKSVSGPIGIAQVFGKVWDWGRFWMLTGMISMVLAMMNLLPIPALDGGHVVFLLYEIITGRKPSDRFLEIAQYAGMTLLLSLMVFAFYNDIVRIFFQ
jgi:regulator of sigma E protease